MFKYVVHQDPNWDWRTFDLDLDIEAADRQYKRTLNPEDPDLSAFRARGGKLLLWHGWSDPAVPPQGTIDYYERVASEAGAGAQDFVRLFLVPGMSHCQGGPGANQFNSIAALERWVEAGIAPTRILAFRIEDIAGGVAGLNGSGLTQVEMTRPLCPYPQVAQWRGIGTPNDAENFVCQLPGKGPRNSSGYPR
jgi:feruloyl esterase